MTQRPTALKGITNPSLHIKKIEPIDTDVKTEVDLAAIFLENVREKNKYSEQIERLQEKIAFLEDRNKDTIFYAVIIIGILADVICFKELNAFAIGLIFILELIGMTVAAKKLGQETAVRLFTELEQIMTSRLHNKKGDNDN